MVNSMISSPDYPDYVQNMFYFRISQRTPPFRPPTMVLAAACGTAPGSFHGRFDPGEKTTIISSIATTKKDQIILYKGIILLGNHYYYYIYIYTYIYIYIYIVDHDFKSIIRLKNTFCILKIWFYWVIWHIAEIIVKIYIFG